MEAKRFPVRKLLENDGREWIQPVDGCQDTFEALKGKWEGVRRPIR